jgi:hypothetical protein
MEQEGRSMIAAKIFTWFLVLAFVFAFLFVFMLLLPGIIELLAEAIIETKDCVEKLKNAIWGDKYGN